MYFAQFKVAQFQISTFFPFHQDKQFVTGLGIILVVLLCMNNILVTMFISLFMLDIWSLKWFHLTLQLRKMLDLLVHASQCRSSLCQYPNCRKVKGLFRHGIQCKVRASGGCVLCKKMWYLLQLHARACKESECHVPRCRSVGVLLNKTKFHYLGWTREG